MKAGEKYLTVHLLNGSIKLAAFPNAAIKDNPNAPQFKGDGIAVWINTKKETDQNVSEEDVI